MTEPAHLPLSPNSGALAAAVQPNFGFRRRECRDNSGKAKSIERERSTQIHRAFWMRLIMLRPKHRNLF